MSVLVPLLCRAEYELRCTLAKWLRRGAFWLDSYPIQFLGAVHGENGVKPRPNIEKLARDAALKQTRRP